MKKIIIFVAAVLGIFLIPRFSFAAVSQVQTLAGTSNVYSLTTFIPTSTSGENVAVIGTLENNACTITSISYTRGATASLLSDQYSSLSGGWDSTQWLIENPDTGTSTVSIYTSGGCLLYMSASVYTGVDTIAPVVATTSNLMTSGLSMAFSSFGAPGGSMMASWFGAGNQPILSTLGTNEAQVNDGFYGIGTLVVDNTSVAIGTSASISAQGGFGFFGNAVILNPSAYTPPSSQIAFIFPETTSTAINPFPYFWTAVSGISKSDLYQDTVTVCVTTYSTCSVQPLTVFSGAHQDASGTFLQYWPNIAESNDYGTSTSILIPAHAILKDFAGNILDSVTTTVNMLTFKTGNKNFNGTSTQIAGNPTTNASGTWNGLVPTSTFIGNPINPLETTTSTQIGFCAAPDLLNLGSEIAYGVCVVGNWAFNPNTAGNNDLAQAFTNFLNTPPFAYVYTVFGAFENEGAGLQNQTSTAFYLTLDPGSGLPGVIPTSSVEVLGYNTEIGVFGSHATAFQEMLFTAEDAVMILGFIALVFSTVTKKRSGMH